MAKIGNDTWEISDISLFSALIEKKNMNQTSSSLPGAITPSFSLKSDHNINFGSQDAGKIAKIALKLPKRRII